MRAKTVNENINFQRGESAKDSMRVGEISKLPSHLDLNVPPKFKRFGFKYRDNDDDVYLDDYPKHKMFLTIEDPEYSEYALSYFSDMEPGNKYSPVVSFDWMELSEDEVEAVLNMNLSNLDNVYRELVKGKSTFEKYIEDMFIDVKQPEIEYHNFHGKFGIN